MNKEELEAAGLQVRSDHDYNPLQIAEDKFFHEKYELGKNYREQAIDFCLENRLGFRSTFNSIYELTKRCIKMTCPLCGAEMKQTSGGGSGNEQTVTFRCDSCKAESHLTLPVEGIHFSFDVPAEADKKEQAKVEARNW